MTYNQGDIVEYQLLETKRLGTITGSEYIPGHFGVYYLIDDDVIISFKDIIGKVGQEPEQLELF